MRPKKRGAEESLSFLMGVLIAIFILTIVFAVAATVYRHWADLQGVEKCYNDIVKISKELKDGEEKDLICRFHNDYVLMGFDANQEKIETIYHSTEIRITPPFLHDVRLSYARPEKCTKSDTACLCFCKDTTRAVESNRKCPSVKCTQIPGIKNIQGFTSFAKTYENQNDLIVFDTSAIQGILIKKKGDTLTICSPSTVAGNLECEYKEPDLFDPNLVKEMKKCKPYTGDGCICSQVKVEIPETTDFVMFQKDKNISFNLYVPDKKIFGEIKTIEGNLCLFSIKDGKQSIREFSIAGLYEKGKQEGYTLNNKEVKLIKSGNDICFLKFSDWESSHLSECKISSKTEKKSPETGAVPLR